MDSVKLKLNINNDKDVVFVSSVDIGYVITVNETIIIDEEGDEHEH